MDTFYIARKDWEDLLRKKAAEETIFAPFDIGGKLFYDRVTPENAGAIVYDRARPVDPFKLFLFPYRERVVPDIEQIPPVIVIGMANCDMLGVEILDKVFAGGDYKDPHYGKRRQAITVVTVDCRQPYLTCFCELLDNRPYAEKNFDLNLTLIDDGFLVDVGSEKSKRLIGDGGLLRKPDEGQLRKRQTVREQARNKVKEYNKGIDISRVTERIAGMHEGENWKPLKDVTNCVQCGSCTANCPTCVCFLLEDTSEGRAFKKTKLWDSCLFPGYARMAAGASPRPRLPDRYANRLMCKYHYMVKNFGLKGCTGCGRCIAGCIGKIDKRKVLDELFRVKTGDRD